MSVQYVIGDLIEATKGDTVIRGRLKEGYGAGGLDVTDAGWSTESFERDGFDVVLIERAPAKFTGEETAVLVEVLECIQPSAIVHGNDATTRDVVRARTLLSALIENHGGQS